MRKSEDLVLKCSYSYQQLIYQRNTGKYVMKSGIYNYTHHNILGKSESSGDELFIKELTEHDIDPLTSDSANSVQQLKIEKMQPQPMKIRTLQTRHLDRQNINYRDHIYSYLNILFVFLLLTIFISYSLTWFSTETEFLENLEHELSTKVLNQNIAIRTLYQSVKKLYEEGDTKILTCLVGPTGVGKTYSINILQKFVNYKIIHVFHSPDLPNLIKEHNTFSSHLLQDIVYSDHIIIILDDLKITDLEDVQSFIQIISQLQDINMLLISIFNIQNIDDNFNTFMNYEHLAIIKDNLESLFQHFYFAQFNELNEDVIKVWLRRELLSKNVSENNYDEIINKLLNSQDINSHGLKGISSKLMVELSGNT
ncbi:hypothetical protein WA026_021480 [Henosepilachna vigintioctopunctata]|uniref:ATPase AAA-type core domain-containing protein n=1 Tax=Henosepilachna vigintioctopunctata TaxID=420089 RepID=A0AAW1USD9_9CUCU